MLRLSNLQQKVTIEVGVEKKVRVEVVGEQHLW